MDPDRTGRVRTGSPRQDAALGRRCVEVLHEPFQDGAAGADERIVRLQRLWGSKMRCASVNQAICRWPRSLGHLNR